MKEYNMKPKDGNVTKDGLITWDSEDDLYFVWTDNKFNDCLLVTSNFIDAVEEYKVSCK